MVSEKKKKGLHLKFGDLKWKPGTLDGYVISQKITKRSSTIIRGPQMESGALRRLSGSLITLLWNLYDGRLHSNDGPLKCSFMGSYTSWARGRLSPCNPQPSSHKPWVGGFCSVSFVSLIFSWDDLFYKKCNFGEQKMQFFAKNAILVKRCQFRSAPRSKMSSDCTPGIACDKFSPAPLWPRKTAAPLNKIYPQFVKTDKRF